MLTGQKKCLNCNNEFDGDYESDYCTDCRAETAEEAVLELRAALEAAVAGHLELDQIAEAACPGSRIGMIATDDLRVGDALVAGPFTQITKVHHTEHGTSITTVHGRAVFIREYRVLGFRPGQPRQRCRHCGRTWTQGCRTDCNVRHNQLDHTKIARALHQMGLERIDDGRAKVQNGLTAVIALLNRPYTGQEPTGTGQAAR